MLVEMVSEYNILTSNFETNCPTGYGIVLRASRLVCA